MAQRKTLTEQQVELLRWIAEGSPSGVMEGDSYRISAAALRRKGLVTTSGRGAGWSAEVTDRGREYLERVDGPEPPVPRQGNASVTQRLVDDVIAAGGSLRVPRTGWGRRGGVDYRHRALLAQRSGKVPPGTRLDVAVVADELEIRLCEAPGAGARAELVEVAVPGKVGRYHPVAKQFREDIDAHEVSRAQLRRAARIVHAVAIEAERRGWTVESSPGSHDEPEPRSSKEVCLRIAAGGHDFRLRVYEKGVRARGSWERQVECYREFATRWDSYGRGQASSGPYDAEATGELNLELQTSDSWIFSGRQSRWGDRRSWALEERLPHLFREIEERIAEADRVEEEKRIAVQKAAEERRRAAEERERQWHLHMERARRELVEAQRAEALRAQVSAWHDADLIRKYCDAVEVAYGDDAKSAEWIEWARHLADRLDPLDEPPTMPDPPPETLESLQRFLPEGWSAEGPEFVPRPPAESEPRAPGAAERFPPLDLRAQWARPAWHRRTR